MTLKPILWTAASGETLQAFIDRCAPRETIDQFEVLLSELFEIRNPRFKFKPFTPEEFADFRNVYTGGKPEKECGSWVFFPWSAVLVHFLPEAEHYEVRTSRNKNIITAEEQDIFKNFTVAVAGLSVGSHAAITIHQMGGSHHIKIADPDMLGPANLNRLRLDFTNIGKKKCDIVYQYLYQVDPYSNIDAYPEGVTAANIEQFLDGVDLVVEEMDNPEMKIFIREKARERGIPVLMATDNGDSVIVDVERYDLNASMKLFDGAAGDISVESFRAMDRSLMPKLATQIAGPQFVVPRMLSSVSEVGRTLYSWPQLGDAATLAGVVAAYAARRLALKLPLKSGKFEVNLDESCDPTYFEEVNVAERSEQRRKYLNELGL